MMTRNDIGFVLRTADGSGAQPVLTAVHAEGRLDGVLFTMALRQTYQHLGDNQQQVVCMMPLPPRAVLLGMAADIDGRRLQCTVLPGADGDPAPRAALALADLPNPPNPPHPSIALQTAGSGVHTSPIGRLAPGAKVVIEVRFAQWLTFDNGKLRLSVPTAFAPRVGSGPQGAAFGLSVTIAGSMAAGAVECPTHRLAREKAGSDVRLTLASPAGLDRDVVLVVTPRQPFPALAMRAVDRSAGSTREVALAAFQVPAGEPRPRIALKLLVDGSAAMAGDAIASVRRALQAACRLLRPGDTVSLSRYGSTLQTVLAPVRVDPGVASALAAHVAGLQADMDAPQLPAALRGVFALPCPASGAGADVLLVTAGEVFGAEPLVRAARTQGHRVFAIGVGAAPAASLLRELAEASHGACEFAAAGGAVDSAVLRMMARIRQQPWAGVHVAWASEPAWQLPAPTSAFGGDTALALAGFTGTDGAGLGGAVRLLGRDALGSEVELARVDDEDDCPGDVLPRMAAARRLTSTDDLAARRLALEHQLLSPQTHAILQGAPPPGAPAHEAPAPPDMLQASWPAPTRMRRLEALAASGQRVGVAADDPVGAAAEQVLLSAEAASLRDLMTAASEHLAHGGTLRGLEARCVAFQGIRPISEAIQDILALPISAAGGWLLLALWVARRPGQEGNSASAALLALHADFIDADLRGRAWAQFERRLGSHASDGWQPSPGARQAADAGPADGRRSAD